MNVIKQKTQSVRNNNNSHASTTSLVNGIVDDLPIYQMVYIAQVTYTALFTMNFFKGLDEKIYQYNKEHALTSILCFGNGCFLQYTEGSEESLTNLKNKLLNSDRYIDFHLYDFSKIANRRFPKRHTGFVVVNRNFYKNRNENAKDFNPFRPLAWSLNKQLEFFLSAEASEDIQDRFYLTLYDSLLLRLKLATKLGSEALTKQQMHFSLGVIFTFSTLVFLLYLILSN